MSDVAVAIDEDLTDVSDELSSSSDDEAPVVKERQMALQVSGMTCGVCSGAVERALLSINGVREAHVNLVTGRALVVCTTTDVSVSQCCDTVEAIGYDCVPGDNGDTNAGLGRITFPHPIQDWHLEVICAVPGVISVERIPSSHDVQLVYDPATCRVRHVLAALAQSGVHDCRRVAGSAAATDNLMRSSNEDHDSKRLLNQLVYAMALTLPMGPICMMPSFKAKAVQQCSVGTLLLALLATPVQFVIGRTFYRRASHALRSGTPTMDVLVVLGTTAAYAYSLFSLLAMLSSVDTEDELPTFFESSALLITFVLLGKYLEMHAKQATRSALRGMMQLAPSHAVLLDNPDLNLAGRQTQIDVSLLEADDHVVVHAGAAFPGDGVIVVGETAVNEAVFTGESSPVPKANGDMVLSATTNIDAVVVVRLTKTGADTALGQMIRTVEDAQARRAPIQAQADKVAAIFVPGVVTLSMLTFIIWYALLKTGVFPAEAKVPPHVDDFLFAFMFAISVTVISCPCALGLATPTAVMVATGVAARLGILIKGGAVLEAASKATVVLFDKTGTLTVGAPHVVSCDLDPSRTADWVWSMVGCAELQSEHPVGRALYSTALGRIGCGHILPPAQFTARTGAGVRAETKSGDDIVIGSKQWLGQNDVTWADADTWIASAIDRCDQQGQSHVIVAVNGAPCAVIGLADACKPEAPDVIAHLDRMGIHSYIVTGDNDRVAGAIARQVGIRLDRTCSQQLPMGKAQIVEELQRQGHVVAFVGDGINDSLALTTADVGIALGCGADVAMAAADIVLMKSSLIEVVTALDLSSRAMNRIRLNLILAVVYNMLAIPGAAGLFYPFFHRAMPPVVAGAAMAASSVSVVLSSLLLDSYKAPSVHTSHARIGKRDPHRLSADAALADDDAGERQLLMPTQKRVLSASGKIPMILGRRRTSSNVPLVTPRSKVSPL